MDKITIEVSDLTKVSDGYHTIEELYGHRCLLFINLCIIAVNICQTDYCVYIKEHLPGWFLLVLKICEKQISYHIPNKYLPLVEDSPIPEDTGEYKYDGHTSADVIERLKTVAKIVH